MQWPQNDLEIFFKVKGTHIHSYIHSQLELQIFMSFALQCAIFELQPNFGKSTKLSQNEIDMHVKFKIKLKYLYAHNKIYPLRRKILIRFTVRWVV